jgi:hypothetical protein
MELKGEGAVVPQVPLVRPLAREAVSHGAWTLRTGAQPRCEMCGHLMVASHCKRICLGCGFLAGGSTEI